MGQVLDHVQPSWPGRKRVIDVSVDGLVEGRDQLPDVTDQVEADDAQRDPGETSFLSVRLAGPVAVPNSSVAD